MYYIKLRDQEQRAALIDHLKQNGVNAVFHYVPLHSAKAGMQFGRFAGEDRYTTADSERLLRLPLYYGLTSEETEQVITAVRRFFA
jgi:dTDP-4-amino-4,6-dideoxygalactose transaminase